MVDELEPKDQARLMAYLAPRLVNAVAERELDEAAAEQAWQAYRQAGERLAAAQKNGSMTQLVSDMRR